MTREPTKEQEDLAAKLVDKALAGYEKLVSPAVLEALRAMFEAELVGTDEGQRTLRACAADPAVKRSNEVVRADAAPAAKLDKASGKG